jgi:phage terminase Nu1 subunit (DNA packaging protein)
MQCVVPMRWRGVPLVMQRMNAEPLARDHSVVADILVREEPDEEEEDEDDGKDKDDEDEDEDEENGGYSE